MIATNHSTAAGITRHGYLIDRIATMLSRDLLMSASWFASVENGDVIQEMIVGDYREFEGSR